MPKRVRPISRFRLHIVIGRMRSTKPLAPLDNVHPIVLHPPHFFVPHHHFHDNCVLLMVAHHDEGDDKAEGKEQGKQTAVLLLCTRADRGMITECL